MVYPPAQRTHRVHLWQPDESTCLLVAPPGRWMRAGWRDRASAILGEDATAWAQQVASNRRPLLFRADDIQLEVVHSVGESDIAVVGEKRSLVSRSRVESLIYWLAPLAQKIPHVVFDTTT